MSAGVEDVSVIDFDTSEIDDGEFDIPPVEDQPTLESILTSPDDERTGSDHEFSLNLSGFHARHTPFQLSDSFSETGSISSLDGDILSPGRHHFSRCSVFSEHGSILRHFTLKSASAQLVSAADRIDAGSLTALAVGSLVAVGTSHGVVLVFDAQQTLRWCLGGAAGVGAQYGAVSSLSLNIDSTRLLVGHIRGQLMMWDLTTGKILRSVANALPPSVSLLHVKFTDDKTLALVNDSSGSVVLLEFKRLIGVRTCEPQCLFSGSRVEVCCIEPLCIQQASIADRSSHPVSAALLFAMASMSKVLVVTLRPELRVHHSRPLPGDVSALPLLAWQFVSIRLSEKERIVDPVLACARDQTICFLQVAYRTASDVTVNVLQEMTVSYKLLMIAWINSRTMVFMDVFEQGHVIDVSSETELETIDLTNINIVLNSAIYKTLQSPTGSVGRRLSSAGDHACYQSFATYGGQLVLLGARGIHVFTMRSWQDRLNVLTKQQRYVDALALARSFYDGSARGVVGLRGGTVKSRQIVAEKILELLNEYIDLVFLQFTMSFAKTEDAAYQAVASVCITYCILIDQIDVLFTKIFERFSDIPVARSAFLESIEPHILTGELTCLPPSVMSEFIRHYEQREAVSAFEACIVHMDVTSLDLEQIMPLCWAHCLYDAILYVYNRGMDDYVTPLQELLNVLRNALDGQESLTYQQVQLGNKILVYISCCLSGRAYPLGDIPSNLIPKVRHDVVKCLTLSDPVSPHHGELPVYRNLATLVLFDTREFFNVLILAFEDRDLPTDSKQLIVDRLLDMMILNNCQFAPAQMGVLFTFLARQMAHNASEIKIDRRLFEQVLESLCSASDARRSGALGAEEATRHEERQQALLQLLATDALEQIDEQRLLALAGGASFYRVCEVLHERRREFHKILGCYIRDVSRRHLAFGYVQKTISDRDVLPSEKAQLRESVLENLAELIKIDAQKSVKLAHVTLGIRLEKAARKIAETGDEDVLFEFFRTMFEYHGDVEDSSDDWLDMEADLYERYVELLCRRAAVSNVVEFLRSSDGYRIAEALSICRRHRMMDAVVYLLEKSSDITGAFELALHGLRGKLSGLIRFEDSRRPDAQLSEIADADNSVDGILGLLHRSSCRLEALHREELWFALFDILVDTLKRLKQKRNSSEFSETNGLSVLVNDARQQNNNKKSNTEKESALTSSDEDRYKSIIRHVISSMVSHIPFTSVLQHVVTACESNESVSGCFGNVRDILLNVIDACHYEQTLYSTCSRLVQRDLHCSLASLTSAAKRAVVPRSDACAICFRLVTVSTVVALSSEGGETNAVCFRCGHAYHQPCLVDVSTDLFRNNNNNSVDPVRLRCILCFRSRTRWSTPVVRARIRSRPSTADLDATSAVPGRKTSDEAELDAAQITAVENLRRSQRIPSRLAMLEELHSSAEISSQKRSASSGSLSLLGSLQQSKEDSVFNRQDFALRLAPPRCPLP